MAIFDKNIIEVWIMDAVKLKKPLTANLKLIKEAFDDEMLKERELVNINNTDVKVSLLYFGLLVNRDFIQDGIVRPFLNYPHQFPNKDVLNLIKTSIVSASEVDNSNKLKDICTELMFGKTILLVDGYDEALIIETNDRISRTPTEPDSEIVLRGPREGFTESLMLNISLIRRRLINKDLKFRYLKIGKETNIYLTYAYIESLVDTRALDEFQKKLNSMSLDSLVDTNAVSEAISYRGYSPFEIVGQTERPDSVAAKLLEGKIAVLIDGSPVCITLPFLLVENFHTPEDYYINVFFSSIARIVRIIGFIISILLPGLYVATISYHWEIIPTRMALAIAQAQEGLTIPTAIEAFLMLTIFEILRETGIRTPTGLGQSMSIVGALVIGQAAIQARVTSPIMVFIVATTAITGLINYKLKGSTIFLRFVILFAGSIMGLYGIFAFCFLIIFHISSIKSFGVQYTEKSFPVTKGFVKDSLIRAPGEGISRLDDKKKSKN